MPVSAFLASSGVTAQCQQLELLVLPLQHYQELHRERKESWELTGMGTKGDMSTGAILGLQPPKTSCWDVSSKPPELAPLSTDQVKKLLKVFVESLCHKSP